MFLDVSVTVSASYERGVILQFKIMLF